MPNSWENNLKKGILVTGKSAVGDILGFMNAYPAQPSSACYYTDSNPLNQMYCNGYISPYYLQYS